MQLEGEDFVEEEVEMDGDAQGNGKNASGTITLGPKFRSELATEEFPEV